MIITQETASIQGKELTFKQTNPENWANYGEYELVGHGKQTSPNCGTFNKYMGCLNYKAHNQARFFNEGLAERFRFR